MSGQSLNENAWVRLLFVPAISACLSAGTFYGIMRGDIASNTHRIVQLEDDQKQDNSFREGGPRFTAVDAAKQSDNLRSYTDQRIRESLNIMQGDIREIREDQRIMSEKIDRLIQAQ